MFSMCVFNQLGIHDQWHCCVQNGRILSWFRKLLYDSSKIFMKELYTIIDLHGTPLIVSTFGQWFGQPDQNLVQQLSAPTNDGFTKSDLPLLVKIRHLSLFFLVCFFLGGWGVNLSKHIISLKIKYLYMKNKKRNLKNLKWILKCLLRNSFSRYDECDHCRKKLNFFPAKSHNRHIRMNHIVQTSMLLSVWYVWWRWIEYASLICNMVWMNCAWIIPSAFHIICQMSDVLIFPLHNVLV